MAENQGAINAQINTHQPPLTIAEMDIINMIAIEQAAAKPKTIENAENFLKSLKFEDIENKAEEEIPYRTFELDIKTAIARKDGQVEMFSMEPAEFRKFTDGLLEVIHKLAKIGTDATTVGTFRLREFRMLSLTEKLEHYKATLNQLFDKCLNDGWHVKLIGRIDQAIEDKFDIFKDYVDLSRHLAEIYVIAIINGKAPARFAELIQEASKNRNNVALSVKSGWKDFMDSVRRFDEGVLLKIDTYVCHLMTKFLLFCDQPGLKWTSADEIRAFINYANDLADLDKRYCYGWLVTRIKIRAGEAILRFLETQKINCPLNYERNQFIYVSNKPLPLTPEKYDDFLKEFDTWARGKGFDVLSKLALKDVTPNNESSIINESEEKDFALASQGNVAERTPIESKKRKAPEPLSETSPSDKIRVINRIKRLKRLEEADIEYLNKFKQDMIKVINKNRLYNVHNKQPELFAKLDQVYVNAYRTAQADFDNRQKVKQSFIDTQDNHVWLMNDTERGILDDIEPEDAKTNILKAPQSVYLDNGYTEKEITEMSTGGVRYVSTESMEAPKETVVSKKLYPNTDTETQVCAASPNFRRKIFQV